MQMPPEITRPPACQDNKCAQFPLGGHLPYSCLERIRWPPSITIDGEVQLFKHRDSNSFIYTPKAHQSEGIRIKTGKCFQGETLSCLHASEGNRNHSKPLENWKENCHLRQRQELAGESKAQMSFPVTKTRCHTRDQKAHVPARGKHGVGEGTDPGASGGAGQTEEAREQS